MWSSAAPLQPSDSFDSAAIAQQAWEQAKGIEKLSCWKKPQNNLPTSKSAWTCSGGVFDLDTKRKRVDELTEVTSKPDFWNDSDKAQALFKEQSALKDVIGTWEKHRTDLEEARFFLDVARDEKSEDALN